MEQAVKTWKEQKAAIDADLNHRLRGRMLRPECNKPGFAFTATDGTAYYIAKDGSRRRVKG